ncbi:hypothetical protein GCM10023194_66220 [Planotetraspora phitsanulokensis]|uniref:Uncharacterized protein n=1 Tax=Planotetraspora phitsanulokensis TaxID=575192 RepID=A0A8J3U7V2_9ACTN|nr:DUF6158 family protein [Planotetraspora phitsanulokensis]GII38697.1 hypothetical protein Pph01_37000 [Planotetraspora phitsanulokensis]
MAKAVAGSRGRAGRLTREDVMSMGVDPRELADDDLFREIRSLHDTRTDTLLHGSDDALERHTSRTEELEGEYLKRFPDRHVDAARLRSGARARNG